MKNYPKSIMLFVSVFFFSLLIGAAYGGTYPEKPITFVVHSGPGGGIDILARFISAEIEKKMLLPQPIVVENKPGGSAIIAMNYVYGKKGDPYFLVSATTPFLLNNLQGTTSLSYRDYVPIARFSLDEHVLMVSINSPFKNIKEVFEFAKKNPRVLTVGVGQAGGVEALNIIALEKALGIEMSIVPFAGGGVALVALMGGHVSLSSANPMEALEMVKAKKVRILCALTEERIPGIEDIPTLKEQGYNVVGYGMYRGVVGPPDFPAEAVKVLDEAFEKLSKTDEYINFHLNNGIIPAYLNSKDFQKYLKVKSAQFEDALKEVGLLKKKN